MSFDGVLIHRCNILTKVQDRKLKYKSGTVIFQAGETVTSYETDASGNAVLDASGNMVPDASGNVKVVSGTAATGYLQINTVSGTFKDKQILQGSISGAAKADGADTAFVDSSGHPGYTEISTTSKCRFFKNSNSVRSGVIIVNDSQYFKVPLSVMLPANTTIDEDCRISTTTTGWSGTYTIEDINPIYGARVIHHYNVDLVRVA
jgi:hypothetical protein